MADFSAFTRRAAELAQSAAEKTRSTARAAKINIDISQQRERINKAYYELGRLYYESHRTSPEGFFIQLCAEVDAANERIAALEQEKSDLKAEPACDTPSSDADFGDVVDSTSAADSSDFRPF